MRAHVNTKSMKLLALVAGSLVLCGCQTKPMQAVGMYCADRGRDLLDTVTVAAETGNRSAAIQFAGFPIGFGDGEGVGCGLRSGKVGQYAFTDYYYWLFGDKSFTPNGDPRGKGYVVDWEWLPMPILNNPFGGPNRVQWQLEASAGIRVIGFRAGINIGEIVDFVLGIFTVDIMADDTAAVKARKRAAAAAAQATE